MTSDKLAFLHEHYRDTCAVMQSQRHARDRYFYLIVIILAVVLFDLAAPDGFAGAVGDMLRARLQLSSAPNLTYVRSVLWFLLLGLTVRYCQAALGIERQYTYVHQLEATLARHVGSGFRREGEAYLSDYPVFLSWAHYLYSLVFPVLLAAVAVGWTYRQIRCQPLGSLAVWFDCAVTLMLLVSLAMYLHAFHRRDSRRAAQRNQNEPRPNDLQHKTGAERAGSPGTS